MSLKLPSFFKVRTASDLRTPIPLFHQVITTTDFFRLQPVLCREMVPNDKFNCDIESFARFTPMPFPTIGRIKFINRTFFVPYRQIFEGFSDFIEETSEVTHQGLVNKSIVPYFVNSSLCQMFDKVTNSSYVSGFTFVVPESRGRENRPMLSNIQGLVLAFQDDQSSEGWITIGLNDSGSWFSYFYRRFPDNEFSNVVRAGNYRRNGNLVTFNLDTIYYADLRSYFNNTPYTSITLDNGVLFAGTQSGISNIDKLLPEWISEPSGSAFDYVDAAGKTRKFTSIGRQKYNLLLSLGYRVDFSSDSGSYSNVEALSAGKALAYLRVYLDYYSDTFNEQFKSLYKYFKTRPSTGVQYFSRDESDEILQFSTVNYDRDYFTAAWLNPASPDYSGTHNTRYSFPDQQGPNGPYLDGDAWVAAGSHDYGDYVEVQRPSIMWNNSGSGFSQYLVDVLKDLQMYLHRHQLAGYRTVDRYLAEFGVKLSDDRSNRCYYLGSNDFSAQIGDVMSNSETSEAKLGDYAGKAVAYGQSRKFDFETNEYGYFIVVSSCVPDVGYVQGIDRENLHLTKFDFHSAQFDNLGTQAIENRELYQDYGLAGVDGNGVVTRPQDFDSMGVFGFIPRYAEYKLGRDFLTGDFAIPSRRRGMDSFHLYRLFSGREDVNLNSTFRKGDQEQYDRVFNNQSSEYDHIYLTHSIKIDALRPMKSISETIDWDEDLGKEVKVDAAGTQFN